MQKSAFFEKLYYFYRYEKGWLKIIIFCNTAPSVSLFLQKALIKDDGLNIITRLIRDRLIGGPDSTHTHTCILDLGKNELSSESVLALASEVDKSHVWYLDISGNKLSLNEKAQQMLSKIDKTTVAELKVKLSLPKTLNLLPREICW